MKERVEFEMTQEDLENIIKSCKPTPAIFLSGGIPLGRTAQENANTAWCALGARMGFDGMTVKPSEKGDRFFTAIPTKETRRDEEEESVGS